MIKILPSFISKVTSKKSITQKINWGTGSDVFIKTTNNIGASTNNHQETNLFIEWAKNTGFNKSQLQNIILNPQNRIGNGFSNSVYRLPENDDYVLRMKNHQIKILESETTKEIEFKDTEDKNLKINIGQKIAEIKLTTEGENFESVVVEVLKKQEGEALGIPPEFVCCDEELAPNAPDYYDYSRKNKYAETIHKVAKLPLSAYEKLIADFQAAHEAGYEFDHMNSNNLLINSNKKSINLIDMAKPKDNRIPKANYANLLYALTNAIYYSTYVSDENNPVSDKKKAQILNDNLQIIDKFTQAMQSQGVKFRLDTLSNEFYRYFLQGTPCKTFCKLTNSNTLWQRAKKMGIMEQN